MVPYLKAAHGEIDDVGHRSWPVLVVFLERQTYISRMWRVYVCIRLIQEALPDVSMVAEEEEEEEKKEGASGAAK